MALIEILNMPDKYFVRAHIFLLSTPPIPKESPHDERPEEDNVTEGGQKKSKYEPLLVEYLRQIFFVPPSLLYPHTSQEEPS